MLCYSWLVSQCKSGKKTLRDQARLVVKRAWVTQGKASRSVLYRSPQMLRARSWCQSWVCIRSNCKLGRGDSKMMKVTPQGALQRAQAGGNPRNRLQFKVWPRCKERKRKVGKHDVRSTIGRVLPALLLLFFKHLYWSIIALQWCVSFCFITKWISYTYTYVPISLPSCISLPPTLPIPRL